MCLIVACDYSIGWVILHGIRRSASHSQEHRELDLPFLKTASNLPSRFFVRISRIYLWFFIIL